jgi:hypothetical protein
MPYIYIVMQKSFLNGKKQVSALVRDEKHVQTLYFAFLFQLLFSFHFLFSCHLFHYYSYIFLFIN